MKRKKSDVVQLSKIRMREELRQKLARDAERNAKTINGEIVDRLEGSYQRAEILKARDVLAARTYYAPQDSQTCYVPQDSSPPTEDPTDQRLAAKVVDVLLGNNKFKAELLRQIALELAIMTDERLSDPSSGRLLAERVVALFERQQRDEAP
jgi:hypothetical protein